MRTMKRALAAMVLSFGLLAGSFLAAAPAQAKTPGIYFYGYTMAECQGDMFWKAFKYSEGRSPVEKQPCKWNPSANKYTGLIDYV